MATDETYYRIYCNTENNWVYLNSYTPLAVCPTDSFHDINVNSLQVVEPGLTKLNGGNYRITSTIDTASPGLGSFATDGGASVAKTLSVSGLVVLYAGMVLNSTLISGLAPPVLDQDATNKKYVDDKNYGLHRKSDEYFQNNTIVQTLVPYMSVSPTRAGDYKIDFNCQFNTQLANMTQQTVVDLNTLSLELAGEVVTNPVFPLFSGDTTILPGVYSSTPAVNCTGVVTFDGGPMDEFIFKITGALNCAASNTFSLINGASADHIFFRVQGAITLGANCNVSGTFISPASAVSLGAGGFVNGKIMSQSGAVSNSGNIINPYSTCERPLGTTFGFAMFSSDGNVSNTGTNIIVGDIGTNNGVINGFENMTLSGIIYLPAQGASLIKFYICIDDIPVVEMTRERVNYINIEDVILAGVLTITENQTISVQILNNIGLSRVYNRFLYVRRLNYNEPI